MISHLIICYKQALEFDGSVEPIPKTQQKSCTHAESTQEKINKNKNENKERKEENKKIYASNIRSEHEARKYAKQKSNITNEHSVTSIW